jgi:hypothetical protein
LSLLEELDEILIFDQLVVFGNEVAEISIQNFQGPDDFLNEKSGQLNYGFKKGIRRLTAGFQKGCIPADFLSPSRLRLSIPIPLWL